MNNVNHTLYIPLYGKAYVSKKNIILQDKKAEEIWEKEQFILKGKAKSKWLAYYMGMRSATFDDWLRIICEKDPTVIVLHLGCGMDSRYHRLNLNIQWYDIDFIDVIEERKKYYQETSNYHMFGADLCDIHFLNQLPKVNHAIIIMEGVSMYLNPTQIHELFTQLSIHFTQIDALIDVYTTLAAKASKYKNPINDVGVHTVYGYDDPSFIPLSFKEELDMTPACYIDQLEPHEKIIFKKIYAGKMAKKLYRLYAFKK